MSEFQPRLELALSDRYRIEREVGRGGTATVYLARDLKHDRPVAVKVLYPELAASLGPERFLREIAIASGLSHPHILPVHDSGGTEGFLYYVMPYVEGESLRDRLRREIQLPVAEALRIVRQVADALGYAHARGLVHRDVKPENILLDGDHAVVADFGVACAIETAASERLTETGLAVGTAVYMSPEQAGGSSRVDSRSDIYSLGCVLFEMLAGEPPFGGGTPQAVIAKHMQAAVPDLRVVRPSVPVEMQRVVETALAKVPADRYASAAEFADALEASSVKSAGSWQRRRVIAAGVAAVAVAAAVLMQGGRSVPARSPVTGPSSGTEQPRLAVLYFDDLSPDSSLRKVANGITEELIYELSGVNAFQVISRNVVRAYRGRNVPLDSVVAALRVNTVVDGSVQRWGDAMRVRVQLIDAHSGTSVDSLSLTRPVVNADTSERSVAQELAAGLRRRMGREARLRSPPAGTESQYAKELLLKARRAREDAAIMAEHPHPVDVRTAIETLARADSLLGLAQVADPQWLWPLIERGWATHDRAVLLSGGARAAAVEDGLRLAEEAVRRAPGSAEALELRGTLWWQLVTESQLSVEDSNRLHRIETDLRAALERDSTLSRAWATLSYVLWFKGSTAESGIAARRALREDTYLTNARGVLVRLFGTDLMLGDFARAKEWCQRGRLIFPQQWRFVECELTLMRHDLDAEPDPKRAWALVADLERIDPVESARATGRGYHPIYRRIVAATISARAGRRSLARSELLRARRATEGDSIMRLDLGYDEAYLRLVLGERRQAEDLLRRYVEARPMTRAYIARDPLFRDLRLTK
ncbi:MAG: protein kinase domain-containing protein [Gemmatimonadales bacterium]